MKLKIEADHGPVPFPNNISARTNLADGEDVVAVMGALGAAYGPSDFGVGLVDRRVVNAYRRPDCEPKHYKSYGYPRTPEFSRIARPFATDRHAVERIRERVPAVSEAA